VLDDFGSLGGRWLTTAVLKYLSLGYILSAFTFFGKTSLAHCSYAGICGPSYVHKRQKKTSTVLTR